MRPEKEIIMAKKTLETQKNSTVLAEKIITDLILIAIGVLFCLKIASGTVGIIIGVALCLYGAINVVLAATRKHSLFSVQGVLSGVIIALGVAFIAEKLLSNFVRITPYLLCGVGLVFVLDAFLARFHRKDANLFWFVLEFVVGAACLVLGLCLLFIESFRGSASVIFGVSLVVFGAYELVLLAAKKK